MKQTTSKRIASLLVCFLIAQAMLMGLDLIFEVAPRASGITITVDDSGGADYTTIQEGVDAAGDGDTVYVYSGVYYEHVSIFGKDIMLTGENRDTTIIDGSGTDTAVIKYIGMNNPGTITKFTIRNGSGRGIDLLTRNIVVTNNKIQSFTGHPVASTGIYLFGPEQIITNNIITDCSNGISTGEDNTIQSNTISNCDVGIEISGNDNRIYNNVINVYSVGLYFNNPGDSRNYIPQNNTINGETVYHFFNVHGTPSSPIILDNMILDNSNISNLGKISLVECSYFQIKNNDLSNNYPGSGVSVISSKNISIEDNFFENNKCMLPLVAMGRGGGIQIFNSENITIYHNYIIDSHSGIFYGTFSPTTIENRNLIIDNNDIFYNIEEGIRVYGNNIYIIKNHILGNNNDGIFSEGNYLYINNNDINENRAGIVCSGNYIFINLNIVSNNSQAGIGIGSANYGDIKINTISNNAWGISCRGKYFNLTNNTLIGNWGGMEFSSALNNTIENNSILNCSNIGLKSAFYSHYNIYSNNIIESSQYGLVFDREFDNTYVNNTIIGDLYDVYFQNSLTSRVTLLNCSFNKSKVYYSNQGSTLTVQWYLDVNVTNPLYQLLPDTPVCIKDTKDSLPPQRYKTDFQGYVRWLVETEYIEQDINGDTIGEKDYFTPHTIMAWNETNTGFTETNMSQSKEENVILDDLPSFNITLKKGWNLISLPLVQSDTLIATVLSSITGNYNKVMWFNTSEGKWHSTDDDLTNLDHTMGFWIHMKIDDTLIVTGDIPNSTSIQLYKGWNLVGNPSFCNHEIDEIFSSIAGNYTAIQWYDASDKSDHWKHYNVNKPPKLNDLTYITSCRGYWVYVKEDCVWDVNNF